MAKKKKFRCYVEFHARISTDIMATDLKKGRKHNEIYANDYQANTN